MANTYSVIASGKLPAFTGSATKIPGSGIKMKICKLVMGSVYPDGGFLASTLETAWGFTRIETIIPCGGVFLTTGIVPASWDGVARKLQLWGAPDLDGGAQTTGTVNAADELVTNSVIVDTGAGFFVVFGY